jgi:hypothetical protein
MSERIKKVLANCEQGLSNDEQAQARRNINAQATLVAGTNITIDPATNTISAAESRQEQADWEENDPAVDSYIKHKPTIPTVNDATTVLQQNGVDVGSWTANASTAQTIQFFTPTRTSDLINDSSFITLADLPDDIVYKATITYSNGIPTCDFSAISAASAAGRIVVLGTEDSGAFAGKLKYISGTGALFENYYAQPMRMQETWVYTDNSVVSYTRYVFDTVLINTFQCTRYGTAFYQNGISNTSWVLSYPYTNPEAQWFSGEESTTSVTITDVMNAIRNTNNYQLLKVSVTGSICHARDGMPIGTPYGFLKAMFVIGHELVATGDYEYDNVAESPVAHIDCSDYAADGNSVHSPWHNFEIEMTIDRNRLASHGFGSTAYANQTVGIRFELVNEALTGDFHDLGVRNLTLKYTLLNHQ